jgi:hypothetical protein
MVGTTLKMGPRKRRKMLKRERLRVKREADKRKRSRRWRWEAILKRIPADKKVKGVEVGVYRGSTARCVLAARPLCTHVMVDPWKSPKAHERYAKAPGIMNKYGQDRFDRCYEAVCKLAENYKGRAKIFRMYSTEAAQLFEDKSLDYVFIDGEHSYEAVKEDIAYWLPKVKEGGWIGGHDYANKVRFAGVSKAVNEAFGKSVEEDVDLTWFVEVKGGEDDA